MHGANPEHYRANTGSKNGFDEAVRGARNLQAHGLHPSLSVVLGPENIVRAAEFVEVARSLEATALGFTIAIPSIDNPDYVPAPDAIPEVVQKLHELCSAVGQKHVFVYSLPWCTLSPDLLENLISSRSIMFNCPVPDGKVMVIKENGALGLCTHTTSFELLNAEATREVMTTPERFLSFWSSAEMQNLRQAVDVDRHPNCSSCVYQSHCKGGCPLWWKFFDFGEAIAKRGGDNYDGHRSAP
jgi:radical SAM protein with 4Fe4S-binding SPASM domain